MPIRIAPRSAGDERHASSERGGGEEEEVLDAGGWVSSTKLNAVLEELATVERESPGEKVRASSRAAYASSADAVVCEAVGDDDGGGCGAGGA
eukprot:378531-Rhodomonas_salina.1